MNRLIALSRGLLLALLLVLAAPAALAVDTVDLYLYNYSNGLYEGASVSTVSLALDGEALDSDVPAFIYKVDGEDGRTMVPVRVVSENLGADVTWIPEGNLVAIRTEEHEIYLTLGTPNAIVDGEAASLPDNVSATVANYLDVDRTMVPLRFVSEMLGATVEWEQETYTVHITAPEPEDPPYTGEPIDPATPPEEDEPEEDPGQPPEGDGPQDWGYTPDPSRFTIVLDAGHGGTDPGAVVEPIYESHINLAVTLKVAALLEEDGYNLVLTRRDDTYVTLADRAQMANDLNATIFVAIHSNSAANTSVSGITTYYYPTSSSGKALANAIQSALVAQTGANDRKALTNNYYVLRNTDMTAVLIELGFMTNEEELAMLIQDDYQDLLAQGIADGIRSHLSTLEPPSTAEEPPSPEEGSSETPSGAEESPEVPGEGYTPISGGDQIDGAQSPFSGF